MKGDFSRFVFEPLKHYSGVLLQQGRVLLDSDWNAWARIQEQLRRVLLRDVVGSAAAPAAQAGFQITFADGALWIGAGRYYVDGVLVTNTAKVRLDQQPFLPVLPETYAPGTYVAYLDVWGRTVNAVQDARIREVALGGSDTTVREQPVWQVLLAEQPEGARAPEGGDAWTPPGQDAARGQLAVRLDGATVTGNRLYLVEIHTAGRTPDSGAAGGAPEEDGGAAQPTFKWSRSNGAVVFGVLSWTTDDIVRVTTVGGSLETELKVGDWVEFVDDTILFQRQALPLWQVTSIDSAEQLVTLAASENNTRPEISADSHPFLRRWDQQETSELALTGGTVPVVPGEWLDLEDGLQVRFAAGKTYASGDEWHFTTRVATGLEWPEDEQGQPRALPRSGPYSAYALLALLSYDGSTWSGSDQRRTFQTLTALSGGGGGQPAPDVAALVKTLQQQVRELEKRVQALERKPEEPRGRRRATRAKA